MGSEVMTLRQYENDIVMPLAPDIRDMLGDVMTFDRFRRTATIAAERQPKILQCKPQTIINTIVGAAVLGLEMDGVTGQAFPVPFGDDCQLIIGYKGYNTLAARSGCLVTGEAIYEGDIFKHDLGAAFICHITPLDRPANARVIGAWSLITSKTLPSSLKVLPLSAIEEARARSAGYKNAVKYNKPNTPWMTDFAAMASKTAKRRQSSVAPLNLIGHRFHQAAAMEEARDDRGRLAHIDPNKGVVETGGIGDDNPIADRNTQQPDTSKLLEQGNPDLERLKEAGKDAAREGSAALDTWVARLHPVQKKKIEQFGRAVLRPMANEADDDEPI